MHAWNELFSQTIGQSVPDIAKLMAEQARQNSKTINLVASESYAPRATMELEGSHLLNKNASGYPPRKSFGGSEIINTLELMAVDRAKKLFQAEHANIQALSSTIANIAVLRALLAPGDRILAFDQLAGGHSSHGSKRHISGKDYEVHTFSIEPGTELINYAEAREKALKLQPKMIVAGSTAYPHMIDYRELRSIADNCGAFLFADIAHVAGLIVAGIHDNPVPICEVATTSTHKTLCGPRTGGLVLAQRRFATDIDAAIAPGLQAAPGAHIIAARAALFEIVGREEFNELMRQTIRNAQALEDRLKERGTRLYAGGTNTHMLVVDIRDTDWDELSLNDYLMKHGVVANTMNLPPRSGCSGRLGLRLGSTPMTIRGADSSAFTAVADAIVRLIGSERSRQMHDDIRLGMKEIATQYPIPFQ